MVPKKKILLVWWYDRKDLLAPFVKLKEEVDITLIFYKEPSDKEEGVPFPVKFWGDYSSPYQLLDEVQPDEVIFFNIDDGTYQISLAAACKQRHIPTAICDHGLRGLVKYTPQKMVLDNKKYHTFLFLLRCLQPGNLWMLPKLVQLIKMKIAGKVDGRYVSFLTRLRTADRYLCYTKANADYFITRDGVDPSRILFTGNPSFDEFFQEAEQQQQVNTETYFLLIDQPFVRNPFGLQLLTVEQKNSFLQKLAIFCESNGHKLYVKLHPSDFGQEYFLRHPAVRYFEQADLPGLIKGCNGVFGFYSTLLLPALCFKKGYVFKISENPIQERWAKMGIVRMLDFFTFRPEQLDFDTFEVSEQAMQDFLDLYIYKPDGKALQRLKEFIAQPVSVV